MDMEPASEKGMGIIPFSQPALRRDLSSIKPTYQGSGTICRNGPKGAAHKWYLTPFLGPLKPTGCHPWALVPLSSSAPVTPRLHAVRDGSRRTVAPVRP